MSKFDRREETIAYWKRKEEDAKPFIERHRQAELLYEAASEKVQPFRDAVEQAERVLAAREADLKALGPDDEDALMRADEARRRASLVLDARERVLATAAEPLGPLSQAIEYAKQQIPAWRPPFDLEGQGKIAPQWQETASRPYESAFDAFKRLEAERRR